MPIGTESQCSVWLFNKKEVNAMGKDKNVKKETKKKPCKSQKEKKEAKRMKKAEKTAS